MKPVLWIASLVFALLPGLEPGRARAAQPPNIVLLYADDMGYGYLEDEHPGELYNLRNDLAQKRNLYGSEPARVKELTALLGSIRAKGQVR